MNSRIKNIFRQLNFGKKWRAGFSLVETLVAIFILSVSVVAPLSLAQKGLNSSIYARDQVTAFNLSQEAIEYVRNVRDSNGLGDREWLRNLDDCLNQECGVDTTAPNGRQIISCARDSKNCELTFNPSTGIYGERREGNGNPSPGWQNSIFRRTVRITLSSTGGNNLDEANVASTVSWKTGNIQRSFVINEKLFNWLSPTP